MTSAAQAPETRPRVVVRAPNWLGDAVLALPALAAVRAHFREAHLTMAAAPSVAALFKEETGAAPDAVLELPSRHRQAVAALRDGHFESAILFPNSFRSAWQLRRAGIPARWGYRTGGRGWLLTKSAPRPARTAARHHADYYRSLVRALGIECDDADPRVTVSAASQAAADELLSRAGVEPGTTLVGLAPGAAYGEAKQWPPDRMADVISRLVNTHRARPVVVGAGHDTAAARAIESWLRAQAPEAARRLVDLTGRTSIGALAGVAARCQAFVSNDSGAMHVAAAVGTPVVAIFGPTDEQATRPLGAHDVITARAFCRPCLLRDCPIDHRCMKRIPADRVFEAVANRLQGRSA